jgi:hypothetical protein
MTTVYEVKYWDDKEQRSVSQEFTDRDTAVAYAETCVVYSGKEQAEIIKWAVHPNLPRAKPDFVYKSVSLSVYKSDGKWYGHTIHDPTCIAYPINREDI